MLLLMIDAHSKWLEIHVTNTATSTSTIELLRRSFASLGIPEVLVSDNVTVFTSEEFGDFLKRNGVHHIRTPPYHPASSGLVERAVQTFKEGMKRGKDGTLNMRLSRFLLRYRITPHSSTGSSPAELMMGRKLRTQLDLMHPDPRKKVQQSMDQQKKSHNAHARNRQFAVHDSVYVRNYGSGPLWLPGHIVSCEGTVMYQVRLSDDRIVRRHADQLRARISSTEQESSTSDETREGCLKQW